MMPGASRLLVLTLAIGAVSSRLCAQAPSQRALNGFLLGQHRDAIAASFAEVLQIDTTPDRWVYRTYLLDRKRRAYMSFKFSPHHPDYAISVQLAGDAGSIMRPFAGVVLGDGRGTVIAKVGRPSRVEHNSELDLDVYVYDTRNYSLELDSRGRLSSIQLFGYKGFPERQPGAIPSLDSIAVALRRGPDEALEHLAPDLEIYRGEKAYTFRRAALTELTDDTTMVARLLFQGPTSVVAVLTEESNRIGAELNMRVWEDKLPGWVWKLPDGAPISEIVAIDHAGRWCLWEIRFR